MIDAYLVAGLGFGDEGKGTTVDYLVKDRRLDLVVRYNGGAQAAHNVIKDDGTHHTFAQFGSGTFHGANTYLSKYMVIDLPALIREGERLAELKESNVFDRLFIDNNAILITPYHKAMNQLRELSRGTEGHGTCGMGVGETRRDFLLNPETAIVAGDLLRPSLLKEKMQHIKERKINEARELISRLRTMAHSDRKFDIPLDLLSTNVTDVVIKWETLAKRIRHRIGYSFGDVIEASSGFIFEGAQGVLLDEVWGFHPHTTWTDTTFGNAHRLLAEANTSNINVTKVGITRTYMTRHGSGPFPTNGMAPYVKENHNNNYGWQGNFRVGLLDLVLIKYALEVIGGVDYLSMTHMDSLSETGGTEVCAGYNDNDNKYMRDGNIVVNKPGNIHYQAQLGNYIAQAKLNTINIAGNFSEVVSDLLKTKVGIESYGPYTSSKRRRCVTQFAI